MLPCAVWLSQAAQCLDDSYLKRQSFDAERQRLRQTRLDAEAKAKAHNPKQERLWDGSYLAINRQIA
jgi:hypothetical protein